MIDIVGTTRLRPGDRHFNIGGRAQLLRTVAAYSNVNGKGDGLRLDVVRGSNLQLAHSYQPQHQWLSSKTSHNQRRHAFSRTTGDVYEHAPAKFRNDSRLCDPYLRHKLGIQTEELGKFTDLGENEDRRGQ